MRETIPLLLFALLAGINVSAQSLENLVSNPVQGFTYAPAPGRMAIAAELHVVANNSVYDRRGDLVTYKSLSDGRADPVQSVAVMNIVGQFAFTENIGVGVEIPYYLSQKLQWNPTPEYEDNYSDQSGETGIGDMTIVAWYFFGRSHQYRAIFTGAYQIPTGSWPDETSESNVASTGSGHTAFICGLVADLKIGPTTLLSAAWRYTLNNQTTFTGDGSSWDSKNGDVISVTSKVSQRITSRLSIGLEVADVTQEEDEIDGQIQQWTDWKYFRITPMVGYQVALGYRRLNLTGGYLLFVSGNNSPKWQGFAMHTSIHF